MLEFERDRRSRPRVSLTRACKVFDPRSRKYLRGTTGNVSSTGMLLRLDRPLDLDGGDRLYLAVPRKRNPGLLRSSEMIEAHVVRSHLDAAGASAVAVRFHDPCEALHLPVQLAA